MKYRDLAVAAQIGTMMSAQASQAHDMRVIDIFKNQALIGKVISVRSCMGIHLRADTDTSEDLFVLYPCDRSSP